MQGINNSEANASTRPSLRAEGERPDMGDPFLLELLHDPQRDEPLTFCALRFPPSPTLPLEAN